MDNSVQRPEQLQAASRLVKQGIRIPIAHDMQNLLPRIRGSKRNNRNLLVANKPHDLIPCMLPIHIIHFHIQHQAMNPFPCTLGFIEETIERLPV
ncbi:hypothetical protein D3C84_1123510 [compost metagenome]